MDAHERATELLIEILSKLGFDDPDGMAGSVEWIGGDIDD